MKTRIIVPMKRRKAIASMALVGGGAVAAYSGYKWYGITRSPELEILKNQADTKKII